MLVFQEDYQNQLSKIKKFACSKSRKIQMINALLTELKSKSSQISVQKQSKRQTQTTEDTIFSDASMDLNQQIADLEEKIILKRDIKIELNEEIEDAQEQLQSIEKTVFMKKQLDDQLKRKIDMKMFEIQVTAFQEKKKQVAKATKSNNKTFSIFSRKVLDFFS